MLGESFSPVKENGLPTSFRGLCGDLIWLPAPHFNVKSTGISDLSSKWVRLAQNGTNPGIFQISSPSQNVLKSDIKSHRFVTFRTNLTHLKPKSSNCEKVCAIKETFVSQERDHFTLLTNWRFLRI